MYRLTIFVSSSENLEEKERETFYYVVQLEGVLVTHRAGPRAPAPEAVMQVLYIALPRTQPIAPRPAQPPLGESINDFGFGITNGKGAN